VVVRSTLDTFSAAVLGGRRHVREDDGADSIGGAGGESREGRVVALAKAAQTLLKSVPGAPGVPGGAGLFGPGAQADRAARQPIEDAIDELLPEDGDADAGAGKLADKAARKAEAVVKAAEKSAQTIDREAVAKAISAAKNNADVLIDQAGPGGAAVVAAVLADKISGGANDVGAADVLLARAVLATAQAVKDALRAEADDLGIGDDDDETADLGDMDTDDDFGPVEESRRGRRRASRATINAFARAVKGIPGPSRQTGRGAAFALAMEHDREASYSPRRGPGPAALSEGELDAFARAVRTGDPRALDDYKAARRQRVRADRALLERVHVAATGRPTGGAAARELGKVVGRWLTEDRARQLRRVVEGVVGTGPRRDLFECEGQGACSLDRLDSVLRGVKVLGLESVNRRRYTPESAQAAVGMYEGRAVNIDHPDGDPGASRRLVDRFGKLENVQAGADGLRADLRYNPHHTMAATVEWFGENMPEMLGLSHNAVGQGHDEDGVFVVERIVSVRSVDLVADPASTHGLYESRRPGSSCASSWGPWDWLSAA
jgi:hypothetical protein